MHCKFLTVAYEHLIKGTSAHIRCQPQKYLQLLPSRPIFSPGTLCYHMLFPPHMMSSSPTILWLFRCFHCMGIQIIYFHPNLVHRWDRYVTARPKRSCRALLHESLDKTHNTASIYILFL